jgi:hypothetical protein
VVEFGRLANLAGVALDASDRLRAEGDVDLGLNDGAV